MGTPDDTPPFMHAAVVRVLLLEERRRVSWAMRNYPAQRERKVSTINRALDHLTALEEKANEPVQKAV